MWNLPWSRCYNRIWPSHHIREITLKAHNRANHTLRCFISGDSNLLVNAFSIYVRPLLEYNSIIWSRCLKKDIELLEKVQRRFTERLQGLKHLKYTICLSRLGLHSLQLRRLGLHTDLFYCYEIIFLDWHVFMFTNISCLRHQLSQDGIHTSCIKHSVRIENSEISSMNELLMHGTHCLLMLTFPRCPGLNNLFSKSIFHSFCSLMSHNHLVRFWRQHIFYYFVCFLFFSLSFLVWVCVFQ